MKIKLLHSFDIGEIGAIESILKSDVAWIYLYTIRLRNSFN